MSKDFSINRGGRPKKKFTERRNHNVVFRLNEEEHKTFKELFKESKAPTVRRFLMDAYLSRRVVSVGEGEAELFSVIKSNVRDIHGIAANVNQLAAKINSMKGDVSDTVLGYELKKNLKYLSEIMVLEEKIVEFGGVISERFFANDR